MKTSEKYRLMLLITAVIFCGIFFLAACGDDDPVKDTDSSVVTASNAAYLSIGISQTSVKTDNSDSATVTATLLDEDHVPIPDVSILFTTSGGQISSSNALTDSDGQASIKFQAGTNDQSNQTVTVIASAVGVSSAQVPIQVTGTTIALESGGNNLEIGSGEEGADTDTLIITVLNAGQQRIYNADVGITVGAGEPLTVSANSGKTDVNGQVEISVTGTGAGEGVVTISSMGVTNTQTYTVGSVGQVFGITLPAIELSSISTWNANNSASVTDTSTITVLAPGANNVTFGTTLGQLTNTDGDTGQRITATPDANHVASVTFSSTEAGLASIQVYDTAKPSTQDSISIAVSAPAYEARQISLQASASVLSPSTGDNQNTITLTAKVLNSYDQVVSRAAVGFSIKDPTGGGEKISPVVVFTDVNGIAKTTFTSGVLSSDSSGVECQARLLITENSAAPIYSEVNIIIGGTAGAIGIGKSTKIESIDSDTAYKLPMSVIVADSNGNPAPNTVVSLKLWPVMYRTGLWVQVGDEYQFAYEVTDLLSAYERDLANQGGPNSGNGCDDDPLDDIIIPCRTRFHYLPAIVAFENEDKNRNLINDPDEDLATIIAPAAGDGQLTPPISAAGTVPSTVTTDEYGVANFDLIYLKGYAEYIETEITATAMVHGTETKSMYAFWLPHAKVDEKELPPSPFNPPEGETFWVKYFGFASF